MRDLDGDVVAVVTSAGQGRPGDGTRRVGSTRHDVDCDGYGYAVNFFLQRDGERLTPRAAPDVYAAVVEAMSPNWPGLGVYGDFIHISGNPLFGPGTWGFNERGVDNVPSWAIEAYNRGRQTAKASNEP